MFVPQGSILKWVGTFDAWSFDTLSLDDAVGQVTAYLKNSYNLVVTDYEDTLGGSLGAGTVSLTLQTGMDRGDTGSDDGVADIKSNVDDAWSQVQTYGSTPPNLSGSQCAVNSVDIQSGGGGPAYSFSFRNLLPSFLGGAPVTPDQQAQYTAQGQSQIRSVATNAADAYGAKSTVAATAQDASATNVEKYASDEKQLAADQNKAAASSDTWLLVGLGIAGAIVLLVVLRPYVAVAAASRG